jgi:hypothetical protein
MSDMSLQYHVTDAGKPTARCTCPQGLLHCMCKYVVKVISLNLSYTDVQVILALGTRAGTSMQGLNKLHSNTAAQPQKQLDPLAELGDVLALTSMEQDPEQEAAAAPATASAPTSAPAPAHESAACQHQVQTVLGGCGACLLTALKCSSTWSVTSTRQREI